VGKGGLNNAKNQRNHIAGTFKFTVILYFASPQAMRFNTTKRRKQNKSNHHNGSVTSRGKKCELGEWETVP